MKLSIFILILALAAGCTQSSEITLSPLFSDGMVLQQEADAPIWGWAKPNSTVEVTASWNEKIVKTKANAEGKFIAHLATPAAGGPFQLTITSENSISIKDVMIGEVWICSGQSNMELMMRELEYLPEHAEAIHLSENKNIRYFNVKRTVSFTPIDSCHGSWIQASPESLGQFSAVAYYFARNLWDSLQVPVGMLIAPWGGSPIEAWIPVKVLEEDGSFEDLLAARQEEIEASIRPREKVLLEFQKWLDKAGEEHESKNKFVDLEIPSRFDLTKFGGHNGALWMKKTISLPSNLIGKDLVLSLGTIDDLGQVFVNGELIWQELFPSKSYSKCKATIPETLTASGELNIKVRLLNILWGGGLTGPAKEMVLYAEDDEKSAIGLDGIWKAKKSFSTWDADPMPKEGSANFQMASALYNGMIAPITPYASKGFLWYQGETNVGRKENYTKTFEELISTWRADWSNEAMPFYFVQIAPYSYGGGQSDKSQYLREYQMKTLEYPFTGMAVTLDIGMNHNIHPVKKREVGERLALWALNKDYGYESLVYSGPLYTSSTVENNKIRISFDHAEGLLLDNQMPGQFEICGQDKVFKPADAFIDGNDILVSNAKITNPLAARYCWSDTAYAVLFNSAGLPASSFRTDSF